MCFYNQVMRRHCLYNFAWLAYPGAHDSIVRGEDETCREGVTFGRNLNTRKRLKSTALPIRGNLMASCAGQSMGHCSLMCHTVSVPPSHSQLLWSAADANWMPAFSLTF